MLIATVSFIIVALTITVVRLDARLRENEKNAEYTRNGAEIGRASCRERV